MAPTSCAASASFSSRSSRFNQPMVANAPDPGAYEAYDYNTMGSGASSAGRRQSMGAFGGRSSREMPWLNEQMNAPSGGDAPVRSSFTPRSASPSAAFRGSDNRFANPKDATPGPGAYTQRTPLSPSTNRLNRSSSFGGRAKRFGMLKEDATPAPGAFEAKPGAFASASKKSNNGFDSRSTRGSPFAGSAEANAAPAPGSYGTHADTGAFPRASSPRKAPGSAAFASRSSRFDRNGSATGNAGPDPTAYDSHTIGTMASSAGKTFNKASNRGGGGFGSSARRPEFGQSAFGTGGGPEVTPGPGAYTESPRRSESPARARPSAAFASKTQGTHDSYLRKTDSPATTHYDAYKNDGIGSNATKSFNKKNFGTMGRAARPLESAGRHDDTPAPGSYAAQDPTRPTCTAAAHSARHSRANSAFASTEPRDTSKWTGANRE